MAEQKTKPIPNLYQRLNSVKGDAKYVQKTGTVDMGRNSYKSLEASVVKQVSREALIRHGVVIVPEKVSRELLPNLNKGVRVEDALVELTVDWRVTNIDDPSESFMIQSRGTGANREDKGEFIAMTGAQKYMLITLLELETGDDAESSASAKAYEEESQHRQALEKQIRDLLRTAKAELLSDAQKHAETNKITGSPKQLVEVYLKAAKVDLPQNDNSWEEWAEVRRTAAEVMFSDVEKFIEEIEGGKS